MDPEAPAFCIPMPPPNITGELHMGHALFSTLQDTLTRLKRMTGHNTLWLPGTDHAGIATHERIMAELARQGIAPTRANFDAEAERWKARTGARITDQIRRLGASCDWSRERYTLDARYSRAVEEAFHRLRGQGLIAKRGDGQWWMDTSGLAAELLARYRAGEIRIIPESAGKTFAHFLENIEPWCLSRQIWWGHKIPVDGEEDVLDTWFSSALWPFAVHGWPEETPDLKAFYPATMIETADDILFFWCARMMMIGISLTGRLPFDTIYLHGIIRDKRGRKMSKSEGNGIDPLEVMDRFSCDGLRFGLLENTTEGLDMHLTDEPFESAKRFCNKLWQASRFALGHWRRHGEPTEWRRESDHPDDQRLLGRLRQAADGIRSSLDVFDFREAAFILRHFVKDDLCDWYIEAAKDRLYADDRDAFGTLMTALDTTLLMAHPMMPFITERIAEAYGRSPLITADWP